MVNKMTHMKIRIIVSGNDKEEAKENAERVGEKLCENQYPFDYYGFEEIHKLSSKIGKKKLSEALRYNKDDFLDYIKKVRRALGFFSDEELYSGKLDNKKKVKEKFLAILKDDKEITKELYMFRHYGYCVGQYIGHTIWIYDNEGNGVRNEKELSYLEGLENKWIALLDVHH